VKPFDENILALRFQIKRKKYFRREYETKEIL